MKAEALVDQVTMSWKAHEAVVETKLNEERLCTEWVEVVLTGLMERGFWIIFFC